MYIRIFLMLDLERFKLIKLNFICLLMESMKKLHTWLNSLYN